MSDETTVLLVKGGSLPDGLEVLLEGKGVFIEQVSSSEFATALTTVAPDLVLVIGVEPLDLAVATLAEEKNSVPLVVVADRSTHRDLRQKYKAAIGTIIPTDLPQSALAHRIGTLSRRAAKGEALVQAMSLAPPRPAEQAAPAKVPPPSALEAKVVVPPRVAVPNSSKAAAAPLGAAKVPAGPAAARSKASQAAASVAVRPVQKPAPAKEAASATRPAKAMPRDELASMRAPAAQVLVPAPGPVPAPAAPAGRAAAPASRPQQLPAPFEEEFPTAAFELPMEMRHEARRESMPPETVRRSTSEIELVRRSEQEALVAQEIEARQRLSSSGDELAAAPTADDQRRATEAEQRARYHRRSHATASAVRLVLCDDDLTRADVLASELREHGLDVMLLSPEHSQVHWPRLRRFAPHGLLVDERSLTKGGRQIVGAFRRDPFLKYVPLVVVPFQRIYREQDARANLAPVFPLLSPLGREELGLLEQLASKGEVVVELSQILPSRLVEVLAENEATCVLSTSGAGQRLTWPIAAGQAGKAELSEGARSVGSSLPPQEALCFLLEQEEAQVVVALRPQIHLTGAEAIGPLLDRVTANIEPPLQHSVAPGTAGAGKAEGVPPAPGQALKAALRGPGAKATLLGVAPPASPSAETGPGSWPTIPAPSTPALPAGTYLGQASSRAGASVGALGVRAAALWGRARQETQAGAALSLTWLREMKRTWPAPLFWSVVTAPALLVVLLLLVWALGGEPTRVATSDSAAEAPAGLPAPSPEKAPAPPRPPAVFDRFLVSVDQPVTTCETLVGQSPSSPGGWDASTYWKAARRALMQGNVDKAHEMMCRAVAREPASPAAEGLAAFYLSRRAVGTADRYVQGILAVDPERRTALELQSDVRSQQGNAGEALEILLRTARLEAGDSARRLVVSRKFSAEAELALKSGDLPMAERLLRRAVVLSPQNDQATLRLAEVFLRMGLREPAKRWAEVLLQGPSKHAEAHMVLGDVARLDGDTAAARKHYEQVTPESGQAGRAQAQLKALPQ